MHEAIDVWSLCLEPVKADLILDVQQDEHDARQTDAEAGQVGKSIDFVPGQVAPGG
jgi:hypothetical protein